jgi:vacuolar-type H+-ATPase subunit E/Vma4
MEGRRERLRIMDEVYGKVVSEVKRRLMEARGTQLYRNFLKAAVKHAVSVIGDDLIITVNHRDRDDAEAVVREMGIRATVNTTSDELVGIVASSRDGAIRVDGTLETRLNLISDVIRSIMIKASYPQG